jgi:hypothetical protein
VNPAKVARPDTGRTSRWCERQYRQIGAGGWMSAEQSAHPCSRSVPSAPELQKNSFSSVTRGSGRPVFGVNA